MRKLKLGALLIVMLLLAGGGASAWVYQNLHAPHQHGAANELIVIEPGMGKKAIINLLVREGIISSRWPALVYVAINQKAGRLQAGEYRFESPITPVAALEKIQRGLVATQQVTIPEGYDRFDIIELLVSINIDSREAIERAVKDTSLIADLDPNARDLEGYLFPDTYVYTRQTRAPQLVAAMVRRFRQVFTPARQQQAQGLGLSVRQALTMASLIEREAKVHDERPIIAGVFYNRLKKNMKLDCDPTFIYAAKLVGGWDNNVNNPVHRRRESPYNTYVSPGLPPGPIASPGERSIEAALNPAQVDYIYFVVNGTDGRHKFSRTEAEHLAAVAAYRQQQQNQ